MKLKLLLIKVVCVDHFIALFVCIIHCAIMSLYFDLFWCGIICMKQTMYKRFMLNFAFYNLMYCHDKLSYRDKNIMIIDTVVKSLLYTTKVHANL